MSSSTATQLSVLMVGLPLNHSLISEELRPKAMQTAQDVETQILAMNIKYKSVTYAPEDDLTPFITELRAHPWDAIVIGFGVRKNPDLTYFMEQLIDAIRMNTPATSKILFNTSIPTTLDAIKRWFSQVQEE